MEEKFDLFEFANEMVEAKTEKEWETVLEKSVKYLSTLEGKEEKIAFVRAAIIESIGEYWQVLTGNKAELKKEKLIIHL